MEEGLEVLFKRPLKVQFVQFRALHNSSIFLSRFLIFKDFGSLYSSPNNGSGCSLMSLFQITRGRGLGADSTLPLLLLLRRGRGATRQRVSRQDKTPKRIPNVMRKNDARFVEDVTIKPSPHMECFVWRVLSAGTSAASSAS